jgi:hypothetical protein
VYWELYGLDEIAALYPVCSIILTNSPALI